MPYDYLTINELGLANGIVSASYLSQDLQSLYEQQILNSENFFGDSNDDILELSVYNSNQEIHDELVDIYLLHLKVLCNLGVQ